MEIKIDSTGSIKVNLERLQIQTPQTLFNGEIIKAEVISKTAEQAVLRTPDGILFHATLLPDIQLSVKDQVELLIETKSPNQFVMHLLSAEQKVYDKTAPEEPDIQNTQESVYVSRLFKSIDLKPTTERVFGAINIMHQHPSISPTTAVFLIANKIPATRQNIMILEEITAGKNFIDELKDLYSDIADAVGQNNTESVQAEEQTGQGFIQTADLGAEKQALHRQQPLENQKNISAQMGKQAINEGSFIKTMTDKGAVFKFQKQPAAQPMAYEKEPEKTIGIKEIAEKIRSFFISIREEKDGDTLKNTSESIIKNLLELKFLLQSSDLKNRDQWTEKLDRILTKLKFSSDIDRFTCLQLPVQINQQLKTVDLLIYRRKKDGRRLVGENTVLLIALDTQNLGRLEILVRVEKHDLSVLFKLNDQNAAEMIKEKTHRLYNLMHSAGFVLKDSKVVKLTDKTTVENAEQVLAGKASSFVDCKI